MYNDFIDFVKEQFSGQGFIPLHEPRFIGNEKRYLGECIDSTYVSSVGAFVNQFEEMIADKTGVKYAVATVNGTAALHASLILAGVGGNDEVLTQPLTFVATCNAISYCNAAPIFIDVDIESLGMSAIALEKFLSENTYQTNQGCFNKHTAKQIKACVPMHTFGHACQIDEIQRICDKYDIILIEDAAEALGSNFKDKPLGSYGQMSALSFNGNKIITSGGGGAILTNDEMLAQRAKYITTTAKIPHKWEYEHDCIAYNYRMPNINAALLCAQLEQLDYFLSNKRCLAEKYQTFFDNYNGAEFIVEPLFCQSNYWLNAIKLETKQQRDLFLEQTNEADVMTRPIWHLMHRLSMFKNAQYTDLSNAEYLADLIVNIPSSVRVK